MAKKTTKKKTAKKAVKKSSNKVKKTTKKKTTKKKVVPAAKKKKPTTKKIVKKSVKKKTIKKKTAKKAVKKSSNKVKKTTKKKTTKKKTAKKEKNTKIKIEKKKKLPIAQIDEIVIEVAGMDVVPLARTLRNRTNVSEFELAEKIECEINLTRNMLYRLYDNNLVSFTRKKDKKKGWYIYYWTFNESRASDLIREIKQKKLDRMKERVKREKETQYYYCDETNIRMDFETAADYNFKCPESGLLLDVEDNTERIQRLTKAIERLEKEIKELD